MGSLILTANQTGKTIQMIKGTGADNSFAYALMADSDWGNADFATTYGGARQRLGNLPAFAVAQNRAIKLHFRVRNVATKDAAANDLHAAYVVSEDMRRYGGTLTWQSAGQTYRQYFDVLTAAHDIDWSGNNGENLLRPEFTIALATAPYCHFDGMDTTDDFSTDTITAGSWTKDSTAAATISGGSLHLSTSAALTRYRHTFKGYLLGDVEVTMKVTTSPSVSGCIWGVSAKADPGGVDTMLVAELVAGTNVIRVRKYIAATGTDLATAAFTPAASTAYWIRLRIEGLKVTAEVYTSAPTPVSTASASCVYTLTADEAARFATGHTGFRATGVSSDLLDDWSSMPYTYKLVQTPDRIALVGSIPGDVAAQADISLTPFGGSASPVFGLVGVTERPDIVNLCWNGDFESATIGTDGWTNAAVTSVIAACTSIARDTTAARVKYGSGGLQFVCPATTNTGPSFLIRRRFRRGSTYVIVLWASSAAATTQMNAKLGVAGDLAVQASGLSLTTTPRPYSVIWQPTADRDFAYAAFAINGATATTGTLDGVVFAENPTVVALTANTSSGTTALPVYSTPTDLPPVPFLALIDQEMFRVTAASGTSWTVDPGVENSLQTTHLAGAQVFVLPARRQYEGAGAFAPFDIIEGESYVPSLSSVTGTAVVTSDGNGRGSNTLKWSGMTNGATGSFVWLIDPSTLTADEYSLGEVDVEVWLRWAATQTVLSLKIDVSAQPDGGSTKGAQRLTRETDSKLRTLATGEDYRYSKIGTIPMIADLANALRWQLRLAVTPAVAANVFLDYLKLVPIRNVARGLTRKVNDVASPAGAIAPLIPYDAGWGSTSAMTKTIRADGSALVNELGKPAYPDHGLGRMIEIPAADADFIAKTSQLVPDDPTVDGTVEMFTSQPSWPQSMHFAVTPRGALIRGS